MTLVRKLVPSSVAALADDEVEVTMSTRSLARDGHIIEPDGVALDAYRRNPIISRL